MIENFVDLLFPKRCLACKNAGGKYFCQKCLNKIPILTNQVCPICQRPSIHGLTHFRCQTRRSIDGIVSFCPYKPPISTAITRAKSFHRTHQILPELLAILLANKTIQEELAAATKLLPNKPTITFVPIHWWKEKWRGFNQSQIIATLLAKHLHLPVVNLLTRTTLTPAQKFLSAKERLENQMSFIAIKNPPSEILLIDDVWTTGKTIKTCATTLKAAGAERVFGLTIAR